MINEPTVFISSTCPRCGTTAQIGIRGKMFHCQYCGIAWSRKLEAEDEAAIQAFIQRSKERDDAARV